MRRSASQIPWPIVSIGLLLALSLGVAVAVVREPLVTAGVGGPAPSARPSPSASATAATPKPSPTPTPRFTAEGTLGARPHFAAAGSQLLASGASGIFRSTDSGVSWSLAKLPLGGAGLAISADSKTWITGGATLQVSTDGGASWHAGRVQPPGPGPFLPLLVNQGDPAVWFLTAHGRVLRTRDASISWRELAGLPVLTSPVLVSAGTANRYLLADAERSYLLDDNGNAITTLPGLPDAGVIESLGALGNGASPAILATNSDRATFLFNGTAWQKLDGHGVSVAATPDGHAWIAEGGASLASSAIVLATRDGGSTFSPGRGLPRDESAEAVVVGPAGLLFAYCEAGDVYRSSDQGVTWAMVSSPFRAGGP